MTSDPMKPSEHEAELLAACNAFDAVKAKDPHGFRMEVCPDQMRDLLATIDALRARYDDADDHRRRLSTQIGVIADVLLQEFGGPTQSESACEMAVRVLREQRQRIADLESQREAERIVREDPESEAKAEPTPVNHRRLAVNVLHRIVEAAAGRDRPDYSDAEKIVDAILRAARGGAT